MYASSTPPDFDDMVDDDEQTRTFERIWTLLRRSDEERDRSFDVDREWDRLADRLDLSDDAASGPVTERRAADRSSRAPSGSPAARLQRWSRALSVAVLLLVAAGAGVWWWQHPVSVRTAPGEQTVVTLPDGSTAELNGGTTLSYPRGFSAWPGVEASVRRVSLDGEAFFSVTERKRPFHVETANARVEVLGTSFNVRTQTTGDRPATRVVVASGRVRLTRPGASGREAASVTLETAGETSRVQGTAAPTTPEAVELKYVEAWRQGGFAVFDAPLPTIVRELERQFGVSIELKISPAETEPMSLHYGPDAALDDILRDISFTQELSFRRSSQGYELVRKGR